MSKQQTAVEWLFEELNRIRIEDESAKGTIFTKSNIGALNFFLQQDEALKQAKEMEKKQRIADYNVGYQDAQCNHINDAENYANEQKYLNNKEV